CRRVFCCRNATAVNVEPPSLQKMFSVSTDEIFTLKRSYSLPGGGCVSVITLGAEEYSAKHEKKVEASMLRRNLLQENAVLGAAGTKDSELSRAMLEPVTLHAGDVLYEPGRPLRDIYFPVSATIALLLATDEGQASGIAMIGNDSMLGSG